MKTGVLAVQGAFIEHRRIIEALGTECVEIRQEKDLSGIDGIILPGGESTVQGQLIRKTGMFDTIKNDILKGLPVLATCAGLILLSEKIEGQDERHLSTLPVTVKRNAYGRQLESFMTRGSVGDIKDFPEVFIRAPYITAVSPEVDILSKTDDNTVGVRYKKQLGFAFHPEMTEDSRVHEMFLKLI